MLERITPHLAMIGIHKNGTWAAQKIIECVQSPEEVALIAQNLRPYAPPLLLDQFGNYVVQCVYISPFSNNF
jgi:protein JSN1